MMLLVHLWLSNVDLRIQRDKRVLWPIHGVSGKGTVRVCHGGPMDYSGRGMYLLGPIERRIQPAKVAKENSSCRNQKQNTN